LISNKIKSLIANECAGHDKKAHGISNYCSHEPSDSKQCIYFLEDNTRRCRYFEEAVLPLEPDLEAVYQAELTARAKGYELTKYQRKLVIDARKLEATCSVCGKVFNPVSRRQKACPTCQKQKIREQSRLRKQKQRKRA